MLNKLLKILPWLLWAGVSLFLIFYFVFKVPVQQAGDIVEYYGVTESVINHGSINLTDEDQTKLEQVLHPGYFNDPGYYIHGTDGNRYPVHFIGYSLLTIPFRLVLRALHLDEVKSLWLTNIAAFAVVSFVILKFFIKENWKKIFFLILYFLSPLLFFFIWPGPDLLFASILLLSLFAFFDKKYSLAFILSALASWHSQPLMITTAGMIAIHVFEEMKLHKWKGQKVISFNPKILILPVIAGVLVIAPYIYNYMLFGVATPWTIFKDGWTILNGFGVHNMSFKKLYEQFFDLNLGVFWYAPIYLLLTIATFIIAFIKRSWKVVAMGAVMLLTAFFYQTNPAWAYGTAGYGPSRHALFLIPFMIYFATQFFTSFKKAGIVLIAIIATQLFALSMNHFLTPDLTQTLFQNPVATYVLNTHPSWYNPTPEIFFDRTNHTDLSYPSTAIYKDGTTCKKAYVLITDKDKVEAECGKIPAKYDAAFDNSLLRIANYPRKIKSLEVTFWPEPSSCDQYYVPSKEKPYVCLRTREEFIKATGLQDSTRLTTVPNFNYPGVWKITFGSPLEITVPPGYIVNHYSVDGTYVDF